MIYPHARTTPKFVMANLGDKLTRLLKIEEASFTEEQQRDAHGDALKWGTVEKTGIGERPGKPQMSESNSYDGRATTKSNIKVKNNSWA